MFVWEVRLSDWNNCKTLRLFLLLQSFHFCRWVIIVWNVFFVCLFIIVSCKNDCTELFSLAVILQSHGSFFSLKVVVPKQICCIAAEKPVSQSAGHQRIRCVFWQLQKIKCSTSKQSNTMSVAVAGLLTGAKQKSKSVITQACLLKTNHSYNKLFTDFVKDYRLALSWNGSLIKEKYETPKIFKNVLCLYLFFLWTL